MKKIFSIFFLLLLIVGFSLVDCENPTATGTIQVNDEYTGGCIFSATLDSGTPVTITGSYNFTSVSPGVHTLNFNTSGNLSGVGYCGFGTNGPPYSATCSVTVRAGSLYASTIGVGGNNAIITYTCPQ